MSVVPIGSDEEWKALYEQITKYEEPAVIMYSASWCGPCKRIYPHVQEAAATNPQVRFAKVDVDGAKAASEAQGVTAMPTFHFWLGDQQMQVVQGANPVVFDQALRNLMGRAISLKQQQKQQHEREQQVQEVVEEMGARESETETKKSQQQRLLEQAQKRREEWERMEAVHREEEARRLAGKEVLSRDGVEEERGREELMREASERIRLGIEREQAGRQIVEQRQAGGQTQMGQTQMGQGQTQRQPKVLHEVEHDSQWNSFIKQVRDRNAPLVVHFVKFGEARDYRYLNDLEVLAQGFVNRCVLVRISVSQGTARLCKMMCGDDAAFPVTLAYKGDGTPCGQISGIEADGVRLLMQKATSP